MNYCLLNEHEQFLNDILGSSLPKIHGERYLRSKIKKIIEAPFLAAYITPAVSATILFGAVVLLAERRKSIRDFGHDVHPNKVFTPKHKVVTMCEEAEFQEEKLAGSVGAETIRGFNVRNFKDPRVTRLGKILRPYVLTNHPKFSMQFLEQLI